MVRIGEMDDAIGKQALARREALNGELSRLGAKLAEPGHGAVSPAGDLADSVRISAEARAAQFSRKLGELPLPPFPSPLQLVAALKSLAAARTPEQSAEAIRALVSLVRQLARALPANPAQGPATPSGETAAALVRALLSAGSPGHAGPLARELLAAFPAQAAQGATVPATTFERAAVAILTAVMNLRASGDIPIPLAGGAPGATPFPAALLGFLAQPSPSGATRLKRRTDREALLDDEDDSEDRPQPEDSRRT